MGNNIKKILLLQPMHEKKDKTHRTSFNFPYGMAYIARALIDSNYDVEVIDAQALQWEKEEVINCLQQGQWDLAGISAFSTQYNAVKIFAECIHKKEIPIVVGGPLATFSSKLTLENTFVDICVIGEGEETIVDLINNINKLQKVNGIGYKDKNKKIIYTTPRDYIKPLDKLFMPAYELFDMEKYLNVKMSIGGKNQPINTRVMTYITSRGCPYHCRFCSKNFKGYRSFSAEKIIDEISYLKNRYKLDGIAFNDELFISNKNKIHEVATKLKEMDLFWSGQARVNLVNYELLKFMKENGCIGIGYGIESGSQKILDNMKKGITVPQIEKAVMDAMNLGLDIKVQLIFGYPGEDEETINDTISLFKRVNNPGRGFNLITPLPGSYLYDYTTEKGLIKDEAEYLTQIEKSFGRGKVHVNFTNWSDKELLKRKKKAEKKIHRNYILKNTKERVKAFVFSKI